MEARVADRLLAAARGQAGAGTPLRRELVGGPEAAAVHRCQAGAVALGLAAGAAADVDVGHRHVGVGGEHLPLRRQLAGDVQLDAGHMALARQRDDAQQRVGVALVQLGGAEDREACAPLAVLAVDLGAGLQVHGLLGRDVDVGGRQRVGVARGVEGAGGREVEAHALIGLEQQPGAVAPFTDLHAVAGLGERRRRVVGQAEAVVVALQVVVARTDQQLQARGQLHQVLRVDAPAARFVLVAQAQHAQRLIDAGAVVGAADLGLRFGRHHAALRGAARGEHLLVLDRQVGADLHLVLQTQGLELGVEVALREPGVEVLDLQVGSAVDQRAGPEAGQTDGLPPGLLRSAGEADGAGALIAGVLAAAQLGDQFHLGREAVRVLQAEGGGAAGVAVAGQSVVGLGIERQQRGLADRRGGGRADPRHAVVHAVVVVQVVQTDQKFVAAADAAAPRGRQPLLVDARARAVVVGAGQHGADAQRRLRSDAPVEVAHRAQVAVAAERGVDLMAVEQARQLADLVDRAAGGAAAEQHRGRTAQHLEAVVVEGIALVEGRIAHAVDEHVAGGLQREAAQTDVLLAALGRQEADAGRQLQRVLHGVEIAVVDQLLGDHRDRLRDVAQLLLALADLRLGGLQAVLALGLLGGLGLDGGQRLVGGGGCGLSRRGQRQAKAGGQGGQGGEGREGREGRLHLRSSGWEGIQFSSYSSVATATTSMARPSSR